MLDTATTYVSTTIAYGRATATTATNAATEQLLTVISDVYLTARMENSQCRTKCFPYICISKRILACGSSSSISDECAAGCYLFGK